MPGTGVDERGLLIVGVDERGLLVSEIAGETDRDGISRSLRIKKNVIINCHNYSVPCKSLYLSVGSHVNCFHHHHDEVNHKEMFHDHHRRSWNAFYTNHINDREEFLFTSLTVYVALNPEERRAHQTDHTYRDIWWTSFASFSFLLHLLEFPNVPVSNSLPSPLASFHTSLPSL